MTRNESNASTVHRGNSAQILKDIILNNEPDLREHLKHDYVFCVGDFVLRDEDTFFTARKLTDERPMIDIEGVLQSVLEGEIEAMKSMSSEQEDGGNGDSDV